MGLPLNVNGQIEISIEVMAPTVICDFSKRMKEKENKNINTDLFTSDKRTCLPSAIFLS